VSLLVAATVAGIAAHRARKRNGPPNEDYLLGTHVLGAEEVGYTVPVPAEASRNTAFIQSRTGAYLTSVAAGLTVAGILAASGYAFARYAGWINGRRR
jgi:hypothetical protein